MDIVAGIIERIPLKRDALRDEVGADGQDDDEDEDLPRGREVVRWRSLRSFRAAWEGDVVFGRHFLETREEAGDDIPRFSARYGVVLGARRGYGRMRFPCDQFRQMGTAGWRDVRRRRCRWQRTGGRFLDAREYCGRRGVYRLLR